MKVDVLAGQLAAAGQPMEQEPKVETLEEAHARMKGQNEETKEETKVEEEKDEQPQLQANGKPFTKVDELD